MSERTGSERWRLFPVALVVVGVLVLGGYGVAEWIARGVLEWRIRTVSLPKPPGLVHPVSEVQAMELAQAALNETWSEVRQWKPVRDERAEQQFFVREKDNSGQITFDTDPRAWSATVHLNIEQDSVICIVVRRK